MLVAQVAKQACGDARSGDRLFERDSGWVLMPEGKVALRKETRCPVWEMLRCTNAGSRSLVQIKPSEACSKLKVTGGGGGSKEDVTHEFVIVLCVHGVLGGRKGELAAFVVPQNENRERGIGNLPAKLTDAMPQCCVTTTVGTIRPYDDAELGFANCTRSGELTSGRCSEDGPFGEELLQVFSKLCEHAPKL